MYKYYIWLNSIGERFHGWYERIVYADSREQALEIAGVKEEDVGQVHCCY